MGKHRDLIGILLIVIIGMFIPFLGSIFLTYGFNFSSLSDWYKLGTTFVYFLILFSFELIVVFLYYKISNYIAEKKLKRYKP
jgi:hypothetical protein